MVEPVVPALTQQFSEDLLFAALWERVLDEPARCLLVRATVLRRPGAWSVLCALAAEAGPQGAEAAIRHIRDASLLTEIDERRTAGRLERRFEVHPQVARLACQHATAVDVLLSEGHRRTGDFLAERARHATSWDDDLEAAYHLGEVGEGDRAFDLTRLRAWWGSSRRAST